MGVGRSIRLMQVVATAAQPMLQYDVTATDGTARRVTVFTGTVDIVPPDSRRRFRVLTSDPNGTPIGFYVADPLPLPIAGAVVVAEAWVARMPIWASSSLVRATSAMAEACARATRTSLVRSGFFKAATASA